METHKVLPQFTLECKGETLVFLACRIYATIMSLFQMSFQFFVVLKKLVFHIQLTAMDTWLMVSYTMFICHVAVIKILRTMNTIAVPYKTFLVL
jgi:hypothetical protein